MIYDPVCEKLSENPENTAVSSVILCVALSLVCDVMNKVS